MSPDLVAGVAAAGAAGAACRYLLDLAVVARHPARPLAGVLVVNVLGSLLLGLLTGLVLFHDVDDAWTTVLGTGFCGGFTTFSTVLVSVVVEATTHSARAAARHLAVTAVATLLAATAGLLLASL